MGTMTISSSTYWTGFGSWIIRWFFFTYSTVLSSIRISGIKILHKFNRSFGNGFGKISK